MFEKNFGASDSKTSKWEAERGYAEFTEVGPYSVNVSFDGKKEEYVVTLVETYSSSDGKKGGLVDSEYFPAGKTVEEAKEMYKYVVAQARRDVDDSLGKSLFSVITDHIVEKREAAGE